MNRPIIFSEKILTPPGKLAVAFYHHACEVLGICQPCCAILYAICRADFKKEIGPALHFHLANQIVDDSVFPMLAESGELPGFRVCWINNSNPCCRGGSSECQLHLTLDLDSR